MTGNDLARTFLESVVGFSDEPVEGYTPSQDRPVRLATVDPAYPGTGNPKVTFDGETVMTVKTYPMLNTKVAASDRVALVPVGRSYLVLGKIGVGAWYDALVAADVAAAARLTTLEARTAKGMIPSSVTVGSGSASVAADGTIIFTGASYININGWFDGLGGDSYDIHGVAIGAADPTVLYLRHRGAGVDRSSGHYHMVGYGVSTGWGGPSFGGAISGNAPGYTVGYRQYSSFNVKVIRPNQAIPAEFVGTCGSDGSNQVAGWVWGRTSFALADDGMTLYSVSGTALTGHIKAVKVS